MINEENNILIQLYKKSTKIPSIFTWDFSFQNDNIYVEGSEHYFKKYNDTKSFKKIIIRDIYLDKHLQKKGLFTHFVKYLLLLKNIEAVQLEFVQPEWLKKRLQESKYWYKQEKFENYIRYEEDKGEKEEENEKFSLF